MIIFRNHYMRNIVSKGKKDSLFFNRGLYICNKPSIVLFITKSCIFENINKQNNNTLWI